MVYCWLTDYDDRRDNLTMITAPGICQCGCGRLTKRSTTSSVRLWRRYWMNHAEEDVVKPVVVEIGTGYDTPCWVWQHSLCAGYGRISVDGQVGMAHRAYYERVIGPIPEGLVLDHLCRCTACVNPAHLEPVTQRENLRRGNRNHEGVKLKAHDIQPIRDAVAQGISVADVAISIGVSTQTIYCILSGNTWSHV